MTDWDNVWAWVAVAGMTAITLITRSFFFLSHRELHLPGWVQQGLRYAPLAALAAVVVPEVLLTQGAILPLGWRDPRVAAVIAASVYFFWKRDILGTIIVGTLVMVGLNVWVLN